MNDGEIKKRIDSFPRWHYEFDLKGNLTPIFDRKNIVRHRERKKYFFDSFVELLGGSLQGKRVLDLGCNAGFWSLRAIGAKCDYVLGIDGRQEHIDQANFVFEAKGIKERRYDFVAGNIFDMDLSQFGTFDVVLYLGLMYHVNKHIEMMEKISEVNSDILVIDTTLSMNRGSSLEVRHEPLDDPRNAVDYELVLIPTKRAVQELVNQFGYTALTLKPEFKNYEGSNDYQRGSRRAFVCSKLTDLSHPPFEVEPDAWQTQRNE